MELLIQTGGVFHLALVLFHLGFWRIFKWDKDLRSLSFLNRAIMPALNIVLTCVFCIFGYISLVHTGEMLNSPLGHSLLVMIALVWLVRSILQIVYFKLRHWGSVVFLFFFLLGAAFYAVPAVAALLAD